MVRDLNLLSPKLEPHERKIARRCVATSVLLLGLLGYLALSCVLLASERRMLEVEIASQRRTIAETRKTLDALSGQRPSYDELKQLSLSLEEVPLDTSVPGKIASASFLGGPRGAVPLSLRARRDKDTGRGTVSVSGEARSVQEASDYVAVLTEKLGPLVVKELTIQSETDRRTVALYRFWVEFVLDGWQ